MGISSINRFSGVGRKFSSNTTKFVSPDWTTIPSANMPRLSKEEIVIRIKEVSKQAAKATTDNEKEAIDYEKRQLFAQYQSYASPDRKSLYNQALKTIAKFGNSKKNFEPANPEKTLIDYLNEHDGIGTQYDERYPMAGGGTITVAVVTGGGFSFYIKHGGNNVMSINVGQIHCNGVSYFPTPAEQSLSKEIGNIYYNSFKYAKSNPSINSTVGKSMNNKINITV